MGSRKLGNGHFWITEFPATKRPKWRKPRKAKGDAALRSLKQELLRQQDDEAARQAAERVLLEGLKSKEFNGAQVTTVTQHGTLECSYGWQGERGDLDEQTGRYAIHLDDGRQIAFGLRDKNRASMVQNHGNIASAIETNSAGLR